MAENHIARLMRERDETQQLLKEMQSDLRDLLHYLQTPKFHGDNDYIHIRTDLMPKLLQIHCKISAL